MDNVREILGFEASISIIIKIKVAIVQKKRFLPKKRKRKTKKQKPQTLQTISIHCSKEWPVQDREL